MKDILNEFTREPDPKTGIAWKRTTFCENGHMWVEWTQEFVPIAANRQANPQEKTQCQFKSNVSFLTPLARHLVRNQERLQSNETQMVTEIINEYSA